MIRQKPGMEWEPKNVTPEIDILWNCSSDPWEAGASMRESKEECCPHGQGAQRHITPPVEGESDFVQTTISCFRFLSVKDREYFWTRGLLEVLWKQDPRQRFFLWVREGGNCDRTEGQWGQEKCRLIWMLCSVWSHREFCSTEGRVSQPWDMRPAFCTPYLSVFCWGHTHRESSHS